ncbi:MAG TPA: malectin domain-containing carbohydrate-binding protein [Steroidobacteraceae bacterium]
MNKKSIGLLSALVLGALSVMAHAALPPGFIEENIPRPDGASQWNGVAGVRFLNANRMFAWERDGRVWIVDSQNPVTQPFIDISAEVGGWRDHGLLGFALHPNFINNGYVYLLYVVDRHHLMNCDSSQPGPPVCNSNYSPTTNSYFAATIGRLTRYRAVKPPGDSDYSRATIVDYNSRKVLVGETPQTGCPILYESHSVGSLVFGTDGTLLAACGDGASYNVMDPGNVSHTYYAQALADGIIKPKENVGAFRAQLVDSLGGKIWRIDPETGDGVASNPFYDPSAPRAARSRVWALGLRNPYRMVLRPNTGSHNPADGNPGVLYIGDVGWATWEDMHVAQFPGQNFGWPLFEGMTQRSDYVSGSPFNQDAPNPLAGGSCPQFLRFRDLLVQETLATPSFPNPCNTSQQLPATLNLFMHSRPVLDWQHGINQARWPAFNGVVAEHPQVGQSNSQGTYIVTGVPFNGNTSTAGTWYTGDAFPPEYKNTYFHADYGAQWIRNFVFDENNFPVAVREFGSNVGGVVGMAQHPTDGSLYYIAWATFVRKITYVGQGNRPPKAVITADVTYGPSPLTVQFSAAGSSDPDQDPLTFTWDFGDGSPPATGTQVTHTFTAPDSGPAAFTVTLTARDPSNETGTATITITPNNTPPQATILVPVDGSTYRMDGNTSINLLAALSDAETGAGSLTCRWLNVLHHNEHTHEDSVIESCTGSTVISPIGCGEETYFFEMRLEVTDPQGLTTTRSSFVYPRCDGNPPPVAQNDSATVPLGGNVTIPVLANDTDDGSLVPSTVEVLVPPAHGTATPNGSGSIVYQNTGATLPDEFWYIVRDNGNSVSNAARVTISAGQSDDTTPPTVPTNLTATAVSSSQINLTWTESTDIGSGVAGYRIYRDGAFIGTSAAPEYSDTDVAPSTTYTYRVSAFDIANESGLSDPATATTPAEPDVTPPTVPGGLVAAPVSSSQINLSWVGSSDTGTGVAGYRIYRDGVLVGTSTTTTFSDTGLAPNTEYIYRVSAFDGAVPPNESAQSAPATATTFSSGGGTGVVIRVNAGGPAFTDHLGREWVADTGFNTGNTTDFGPVIIAGTVDADLYRTERWDPPAAPELSYSFAVPNGTYLVRLHFADNYWGTQFVGARVFDVRIENQLVHDDIDVFAEAGGSAALIKSATVVVTDGQINIEFVHQVENPIINALEIIQQDVTPDTTPPTVPTGLSAVAVSSSRIDLSWSPSTDTETGVAGYRIYRDGVPVATTSAITFSDTNLQPNTLYTYTVSAYDAAVPANESAQSAPASATTPVATDTTPPTVPAGLTATPVSTSRIDLSWLPSEDEGEGVAGYRVFRNGISIGTTTAVTFSDVGLQPGTTYTYRVSAFDAASPSNESAQSDAVSATTLAEPDTTPPTVPANVSAVAISSTQINLTWDASQDSGTGVAGYRIYRDGSLAGTSTTNSFSDPGRTPNTQYTYTVSAFDAATPANESAQSAPVSVTTPDDGGGEGVVIRVNAGGPEFIDSLNQTWAADTGFNTGNTSSFGSIEIEGTVEDVLFQTERWDPGTAPELAYSFDVPNGVYLVRLYFAENYWATQQVGARVFDVNIEGQLVHNDVDVYAEAGGGSGALIKSAQVVVTDGQINIQFVHQVENPIINALEIIQLDGPGNQPPTALFTPSTIQGVAPLTVSFDGSASFDPDGMIVNYEWDFGDRTSGFGPTATHTYTAPGTYIVTLTVTDDDSATDIADPVTIHVLEDDPDNLPPVVSAGPDRSGLVGQTIHLDGSATDDGKPVPPGQLSVSWSVVVGPGEPTWPQGDQFQAHAHPVFTVPGNYILRLTASDGALTSTDDVNVTIEEPDTTPPSVPTGLTATPVSTTQINLSWNVSSDTGTGVAGYRIYRDGVLIGTSSTNSFSDTGLTPATQYSYRVSAIDGATPPNESAQSAAVVAATQGGGSAGTVIRVNAGGPAFTDSLGQLWSADTGFNTGNTGSFGSIAIANTVEDVLYQTERWDPTDAPELTYSFTVPNGSYLVRLHFAENYWATQSVGARVFDVSIEGQLVHQEVDIFQQAGGGSRALIKTASVAVSDGQLNITFIHKTENPIINAIEIIGQ